MKPHGFSLIEVVLAAALLLLTLSNAVAWVGQHSLWRSRHLAKQGRFNTQLAAIQAARADLTVTPTGVTQTTVRAQLVELSSGPLKTWVFNQ